MLCRADLYSLCVLFRYLYWGQGADKAGIFRSDLDGRNVLAIVTTVIEQPTGMTLGEWKSLINNCTFT